MIGVPAGATALERRALLEVADEAGIRRPELIPEPIAGAVGCGLDPLEPRAHMVLDIGGGTSEITAFCYGGVLSHRSSRIAGDEMTLTLYRYLRSEHQLLVGELTAEALKCGVDAEEGLSSVVQGIDLATGRPRLKTLESAEVLEALRPTADAIIAALAGALDDLPPQAADDILTDGITVFGGSSLLRGFDKLVESAFAFPVRMAERPLTCVAEGAARCLARPRRGARLRGHLPRSGLTAGRAAPLTAASPAGDRLRRISPLVGEEVRPSPAARRLRTCSPRGRRRGRTTSPPSAGARAGRPR